MQKIKESVVKPIYINTYLPNGVRTTTILYRLWVSTVKGWYYHPANSENRASMAMFHAKVVAKGSIDAKLWTLHREHNVKEVKAA